MINSSSTVLVFLGMLFFWSCKEVVEQPIPLSHGVVDHNPINSNPLGSIALVAGKYNFDVPEKCVLTKKLVEISGLAIDNSSNKFYAVNDEKAYIYELQDCAISNDFDFGKNGDYEGVELVNDEIYVLKSSGKIIQYDLNSNKVEQVIDTPLKTNNDAEGLGFDKGSNSLLIACKGSASISKHHKYKHSKAVYAYDIEKDVFNKKPIFLIEDDAINLFFEKKIKDDLKKKKAKVKLKRALKFSPSAIARNPIDNLYYLLSTVGKTLIVINENNEIMDIHFLDHPSFIQPEGICFSSNGDMFISNEGKGLVANILKFVKL